MKTTPSRRKRQTAAELVALQRLMAGSVMQPLTAGGGMRRKWRDGRVMKSVAAGFIKPNDRLSSFERLEIYNRQYWYRIKDSFYEDFPGLRTILGEKRFESVALAYLWQNPSMSFTLRNLGGRLVKFLEANPRWTRPLQESALDMARLEWAHIEAFDNEAKPRLQVDSLLGADPSVVRLHLQPHLTLLQLGHEVDDLLLEIKRSEGLRGEASNAVQMRRAGRRDCFKRRLRPKKIFLAVHRYEETVCYKRLESAQFRLLRAFQAGDTVAEACGALTDAGADSAQVGKWFETWAALGWFWEA